MAFRWVYIIGLIGYLSVVAELPAVADASHAYESTTTDPDGEPGPPTLPAPPAIDARPRSARGLWRELVTPALTPRRNFDDADAQRLLDAFHGMQQTGDAGRAAAREFLLALAAGYPAGPEQGEPKLPALINAARFLRPSHGPTVVENLSHVAGEQATERATAILSGLRDGLTATPAEIAALSQMIFPGTNLEAQRRQLATFMDRLSPEEFRRLALRVPNPLRDELLASYELAGETRRNALFARAASLSGIVGAAAGPDLLAEWQRIGTQLEHDPLHGQWAFNQFVASLRARFPGEDFSTAEAVRHKLGITNYDTYFGFQVPAVGHERDIGVEMPNWDGNLSPGVINARTLSQLGVSWPRPETEATVPQAPPPSRVVYAPPSEVASPSLAQPRGGHTAEAAAPSVVPAPVAEAPAVPTYFQPYPGGPLIPLSANGQIQFGQAVRQISGGPGVSIRRPRFRLFRRFR
jgi:hypothetical protein